MKIKFEIVNVEAERNPAYKYFDIKKKKAAPAKVLQSDNSIIIGAIKIN